MQALNYWGKVGKLNTAECAPQGFFKLSRFWRQCMVTIAVMDKVFAFLRYPQHSHDHDELSLDLMVSPT